MESALNIILSTENVRTLAIIASVICSAVWFKVSLEKKIDRLDRKIDSVEASLNKRIDEVEASLNKRIDNLEISLNKRIDEVEASLHKRIDELKYNDFAHLSSDFAHLMNAFKALTYVLEKNGSLSREDKEYVDSQLALECPSPS
jgi:uncharacterized protein YPO0396